MNKEIFRKITEMTGVLTSDELTAQEKQRLYDLLMSNGATLPFAYTRFFRDGFSEWELIGVDQIKRDFLRDNADVLSVTDDEIESAVEGSGAFYDLLERKRGLRSRFTEARAAKGMTSATTVSKRFTHDNWRNFERRGILSIIDEYCNA